MPFSLRHRVSVDTSKSYSGFLKHPEIPGYRLAAVPANVRGTAAKRNARIRARARKAVAARSRTAVNRFPMSLKKCPTAGNNNFNRHPGCLPAFLAA